jgi:uncharacterized membrane protein YoaK (UPF0700 family)
VTSLAELPEEWLSLSLAFVGGYGDAAGFVLAKTFTGHLTGNLVLAAASVAARDWRTTLIRFLAVGSFLMGILLSLVFGRVAEARRWQPLFPAFAAEVLLIAAGSLALMFHAVFGTETFVLCLSLALGLQNGAFRRVGGVSVHTTYLTGMVTGLMVTETEKLFSQATSVPAGHDARAGLLSGIWVSFFLGAAAGAAMVLRFKEAGMFGIVLVLFVLVIRNWIAARPAHA